jgi:protein TonB
MFQDALLDARIKTRRGPATVLSFFLQLILVGVVVLLPLIFTQALPVRHEMETILVAPPPPPPPPPPPAAETPRVVKPLTSEIADTGRLITPSQIPKTVAMIKESAPPPPATAGVIGGVPGGVPGGQMGGVVGGVIGSIPTAAPKLVVPKRIRVSGGVTEGLLIKKVMPEYPALARQAQIQGPVQLEAVIGKDGTIQNLRVISGHPMLTQAAINAVKQWRYKPYILNGEPVEVDTTITVNFTLSS